MDAASIPPPSPSAPRDDTPELPLVFSAAAPAAEVQQPELTLVGSAANNWAERAALLDKAIEKAGASESRYASRNLIIVQMWADREPGEKDTMAKICRYAKTNASVVEWVLKMARKGAYSRLVRKAPPGRRGKRQQLLEALRSGTPAADVQRQLNVHRTTVLRALHQLQSEQKTAA